MDKIIPDEKLVEKICLEDKELYAQIIRRYEKKLIKYANYLLADQQKAVDIVQEAFIKAFINLNSFNTKKKFSSWIYRIVHNQAVNLIKKYRKEVPLKKDYTLKSDQDIEEEYSQKEIVEKVKNCLKQIPLIYSEPLALFFLEEKSYGEISDILKIPTGTVATRINRAKIILKKICQNK